MRITHIFTDRPILSTVLSVIIVIVGGLSFLTLPVNEYPDITPPTIQVTALLPGASAQTVSEVVATPLEQEINGVENMLYLDSNSTDDGYMTITVTFALGTNLEDAQVQVQNRVARAEPRLPEQTRQLGVVTQKNSPNLLMVIHLISPKKTYDELYIANYATLRIRDRLTRIEGAGDVFVWGGSNYAMRIWVNPDRMTMLNITADDVLTALRTQNIQVASGNLNQEPNTNEGSFRLNVQTKGRLIQPAEFENIIVKRDGGRIVRLRDIARLELGAESYNLLSYLNRDPAVGIGIFQRPGTNALETADEVRATMKELSADFPDDIEYTVVYNPTNYIRESISEVYLTILEATILVVLVIVLFLQSFRASIIPILAIPISLIGTYTIMSLLDFSLNNLTLFGLVLAIGIVVDDAIIVVEDASRNISEGMRPREAVHKTMDEVGTALISSAMVLIAVFVPTSFLEGITGQFYRQFALTIAVATFISMVVSLTLSPALCALILKDTSQIAHSKLLKPIDFVFHGFNNLLRRATGRYHNVLNKVVVRERRALVVYLVLIAITWGLFSRLPGGFIPNQDLGYFIALVQLPPGSSLDRTNAVVQNLTDKFLEFDGVENTVGLPGLSGATFTTSPNEAVIFLPLKSYEYRNEHGINYNQLLGGLNQTAFQVKEANVFVIPPSPVPGVGTTGGFKMMLQDRGGVGPEALKNAAWALAGAANQTPGITSVFTIFETSTPKLYLDVNREEVERLGVDIGDLFQTLELMIGSYYANDFNYLGKTYQVTAQADAPFRNTPEQLLRLRVRNEDDLMVPVGAVASVKQITGPANVPRYNLYPAAALFGNTAPGYSTGESLQKMEELADQVLPAGIDYEWTELALQEKQQGDTALFIFLLSVVFAFLILSAQYESWLLPLAIILIVPMCVLAASIGLNIMGQDNNILTQIGLVVLIALAAKNAILIVEFAKHNEDHGMNRWQAATEAARVRLRPILMTAFSFILGVVPLLLASGAGSEMRFAIGLAVFSGMLGVTLLGLFFTPVFYVVSRSIARDQRGAVRPDKIN